MTGGRPEGVPSLMLKLRTLFAVMLLVVAAAAVAQKPTTTAPAAA